MIIKKLTYTLFLIVFTCFTSTAQDFVTKKTAKGKAKNLFDRGMQYLINGKDDKALHDFYKVITIEPSFIDAHLQIAAIKYDRKELAAAENGFEKVLSINEDYNPKVFYTLAKTEARLEKYQEAIEHFEIFLTKPSKSQKLRDKANNYIAQYKFIAIAKQNPVPFQPKNLGNNINTNAFEYLPSLTADSETLIYTKRIYGQEDFYISEWENGAWGLGTPMIEINDPMKNEGAQSISADGRFLAFTACDRRDGYGGCDIYYSEVRDGRWTRPANIKTPINSKAWESQPSIAADGQTLYFASTRAGGKGKEDIWMSERDQYGKWQTPKNLGANINTPAQEQAPFIHPDGQTLYFMSKGHPGMGGTDLFYARKQADGTWGEAINLGYPINTEANEGALIISLDGKTAYFASDRDYDNASDILQAEKKKETDLYSFELYEAARPQAVTYVKATVSDGITGKKLVADVEFLDLQKQALHTKSITDNSGEFLVCLPIGKNYSLNVAKKGYLFHSENFALDQNASLAKPFLLDIKLYPIPIESNTTINTSQPLVSKNKAIILKNIFFETASAQLRSESLAELNKLKNLLEENPNLNIQINGHTDDVGSEESNRVLSDNRAKAVYTWLIDHNIAASRLKYKGYGEAQPIDSNDTEMGRQNNRRTEFIAL